MANLSGSAGNDTLLGTNDDDLVRGGDGDDLLSSGSGGSDTLDGGIGTDTATYAFYNPGRFAYLYPEGINANLQTGTVQLPTRKDRVFSTGSRPRNGRLISIENLVGSNYNDTLVGSTGNNLLSGGAGSDMIDGSAGDDTLYGGADNDRVIGGAGNDELYGGTGDDTLDASLGYDTLDGGDGNDTADYSQSSQPVYVNLQTNQVGFPNANRLIPITSIENVMGGSGDDWFIGNAMNNSFVGGRGNDALVGDAGNDTLVGNEGSDLLVGGTGDDWLDGGAGADRLDGGDGNDTAFYGSTTEGIQANLQTGVVSIAGQDNETLISIENLVGGAGNDTIVGSTAANAINSGLGNDLLVGLDANDTLEGGDGNDTLFGGSQAYSDNGISDGDDILFGGQGNDYLVGGAGNDTLDGGAGQDTLRGGTGFDTARIVGDTNMEVSSYFDPYGNNPRSDTVRQGAETDFLDGIEVINLVGGEGNNTLSATQASANMVLEGMGGNDLLQGSRVNDTLYGGAGDDTLVGGMGTNQLYGGEGKDTFVLFNYDPGMQVVHDFKRTEDRLDVQGLSLRDLRVVYDGKDSVIYGKNSGTGATTETARMIIKDAVVDSRDFVNVQGASMQHLSLSEDARKNVGTLVRQWATDYARFTGKTFSDSAIEANGNDPLLSQLNFTQGGMKFSNMEIAPNPEFVATQRARVKTTAGGSVAFTYGYSTENSTETSISEAHSAGFSMGRTISTEVGIEGFGSVGGETSFSVNYDYTRTKSTSTGKTEGRSLTATTTLEALPNSVMIAEGGTFQRKGTADFSVDMAVGGNVSLGFTDGTSVDVPIGAILQTYLPGVFRGEGGVEQKTLAGGMQLAYNANTVFTQAGSIKLSAYQESDAQDYIVQDDLLLDTTKWTHEGEAHAENFWVVNGRNIPNRGTDPITGQPVVLQISGFTADHTKFADKIGIFLDRDGNGIGDADVDYRQITKSTVQIAVEGTSFDGRPTVVFQEGTRISLGSTALVDLVGVRSDVIDSSNFIFSKAGTFFDDGIASLSPGSILTGRPI